MLVKSTPFKQVCQLLLSLIAGPMNVTKSRQKSDLLLEMPVTLISDLKKLVA